MRIDLAGWFYISGNIHLISGSQRASVQTRLKINGTPVGPVGSCGYIRKSSGHNESSVPIGGWFIQLANTDFIEVGCFDEAGGGTATMALSGTSTLTLQRFEL